MVNSDFKCGLDGNFNFPGLRDWPKIASDLAKLMKRCGNLTIVVHLLIFAENLTFCNEAFASGGHARDHFFACYR